MGDATSTSRCRSVRTRRTGRPRTRATPRSVSATSRWRSKQERDERPNKIKQIWKEGNPVTPGWLSVSHGCTAGVMARRGFDARCIDTQHDTAGMSDLWPMLQAVAQTDISPEARLPWNDPATIMKAMDFGAYSITVPLGSTAEDAAKAVAAFR